MRGEYCVAGASIASAIALILLVFANIGQISSGALVKGIYMVELNIAAYGAAYVGATGQSAGGLYDSDASAELGSGMGLRQYYRYGIYKSCGYQTNGDGICNSTMFGYPFEPLSQLLADTPSKFQTQTDAIIPDATFRDDSYNHSMSRAGSSLIFIGSCFVVFALVFGVLKHRIFFLLAAASSGVSAFMLMLGASLWTALIAKDAWLERVHVKGGQALGINVTAGPSLYLTWVAFVLVTISVFPYVIACCTFRK